ncbi:hypothetical protein [Peptacetobacter sp.]|uniref:hypothetical protein n=1 Tax=Peptacetobacter sp. TaxID=2991975 RepID=UPI002E7764F0|nr:hypothetical protein [Peptacetobacter sp.]MEE0451575.1 hypothetical protein [Peptacetobacter sp.]
MKTSTKNVLIGAIATIIGAALGAGAMHTYTTYTNSNQNDNKNNNSVEINIDGKAVDMTTDEYSCAATPQIRQTGNRLSGLAETAYASLLAQCFV